MAGEDDPKARLDFQSPHELRLACRALAGRLHYINRVAASESVFYIEVARTLEYLGAVFEENHDNPEIRAAFGDGYTKGSLSREERRAWLFKMIEDRNPG
ncbi:hypothetical protein [Rhodalgimonas zhirmunskyi]|uniref:Uncharacterized protein n=1 Tax=Rhodalgimonas zhirmunskyi TaxID=2964767 RepID=A0AAJ1UBD4_9RHOB|nr:hypothetical protein [Rhodoalgimonas zhirmunskyi]MDQ2094693.1 hypothetical protein [Rhodoalgimonas zhirmunskyi]